MRSGVLRHYVTIIKASSSSTSDGMGGRVVTWSTFSNVWAEILPMSAKETLKYKQIEMEVTHLVNIRYLSGLLPGMRVKFGSRYFDIVSQKNLHERNIMNELYCREVL